MSPDMETPGQQEPGVLLRRAYGLGGGVGTALTLAGSCGGAILGRGVATLGRLAVRCGSVAAVGLGVATGSRAFRCALVDVRFRVRVADRLAALVDVVHWFSLSMRGLAASASYGTPGRKSK